MSTQLVVEVTDSQVDGFYSLDAYRALTKIMCKNDLEGHNHRFIEIPGNELAYDLADLLS